MRIKDIMNLEPFILYEEDSISNASEFMKKEKIRNFPVVDKNSTLIGLITLREIITALSNDKKKTTVKDVMIKEVTAVEPDTPLKGAIEIMLINKFGCLPVVNKERKLIGIVTETDLLKTLYDVSTLPVDFYKAK